MVSSPVKRKQFRNSVFQVEIEFICCVDPFLFGTHKAGKAIQFQLEISNFDFGTSARLSYSPGRSAGIVPRNNYGMIRLPSTYPGAGSA
jgi:hypothetical protein